MLEEQHNPQYQYININNINVVLDMININRNEEWYGFDSYRGT